MEIGVRIIGLILRLLNLLLGPIFWLKSRHARSLQVPPVSGLLLKSATDHAKDLRNGEITSEKLVLAYIKRIQEVNPFINAVVEDRYRLALEDAREVDQQIVEARKNGSLDKLFEDKPLLGIPCTVKESCSLLGLSNSIGCIENAGSRSTVDGKVVRLIKEAGAIPLLVSNTPEMCLGWESTNLLRGTTNNPYCLSRTAGGSSGGEGALLACGASAFSVASDVAGSIRVPAAFCGVFGHKPTPGIISIDGHIPTLSDELFPRFLVVGPMARKSEDLPLLLNIMAGENKHKFQLDRPVDLSKIKVHFMTEATNSIALIRVHQCIKDMIVNAAKYLERECKSTISSDKFTDLEDSVETAVTVFFSMKDIPNMLLDPTNPKRERSLIMELLKTVIGSGTRSLQALGFTIISKNQLFIPKSRRPYYHSKAEHIRNHMTKILGDNGVFLYPVFNEPAHYHNQVFIKASGVMYTMIFNVLGLPATVVPMGLFEGLPVGIQVVAAPNQDRLCLAVAKQLEVGFGGWRPPL